MKKDGVDTTAGPKQPPAKSKPQVGSKPAKLIRFSDPEPEPDQDTRRIHIVYRKK